MKPVLFHKEAYRQYSVWAKKDKNIFKKIIDLINDIQRDSYRSIGKPEPLKYQNDFCQEELTTNTASFIKFPLKTKLLLSVANVTTAIEISQ